MERPGFSTFSHVSVAVHDLEVAKRFYTEVLGGRLVLVFAPTLLLCRNAANSPAVHDIEAFGPVSTLMPYRDADHAIALAARGQGSLAGSVVTADFAPESHW